MLSEINIPPITLILKIKCPTIVGFYRPIACCSIIYKTIIKLFCSKLSLVLPEFIALQWGNLSLGEA